MVEQIFFSPQLKGIVIICNKLALWKVSKYGVISGPYHSAFGVNTGKYGPEIAPHLDTFHAVWYIRAALRVPKRLKTL